MHQRPAYVTVAAIFGGILSLCVTAQTHSVPWPTPTAIDCNGNGVPDNVDLKAGTSVDCNNNDVPDECDIAAAPWFDCDDDGMIDTCAIAAGLVADCDHDGKPDTCEIASGAELDCDGDGVTNRCETTYAADGVLGSTTYWGGNVGPFTLLWLNTFVSESDGETIGALMVVWAWPDISPEMLPPTGTSAKLLLYVDPNDDGNPQDAQLVAEVDTTYEPTDWPRFKIKPIAPTYVGNQGEVFYVAAVMADLPAGTFPAASSDALPGGSKPWVIFSQGGVVDPEDLSSAVTLDYPVAFKLRAITQEGVALAADLDCDGMVGPADLGAMLAAWGPCPAFGPFQPLGECAADVTQDGKVDGADLAWLLSTW